MSVLHRLRLFFVLLGSGFLILGQSTFAVEDSNPALLTMSSIGDAKIGRTIFDKECSKCHTTIQNQHKKGASLYGIFGKKSGQIVGYEKTSQEMKEAAIIWNTKNLDLFIERPSQLIKDQKMKYKGISDQKSRKDLIAYLASIK